jgi:Predicted membrane-bound metal-dependent hydrolases
MIGKTHMLGGAAAGVLASAYFQLPFETALATTAISTLGSLIPDIDHKNSKISNTAKPVGAVVNTIFGHRGLFHFWLFYLGLGVAGIIVYPQYITYICALVMGIGTHLLLDAQNPMGIPLFYPFSKKRIHMLKIKTGSKTESLLAMGLGATIFVGTYLWLMN